MRILLTNDDGVAAKGIEVLREIALSLSDDVWMVAPATEQSAASRGVSLHNPVVARELGEKTYSVSGTPTDSVIVAMCEILKNSPPDLILSGINHGQNLAEDIGFSGTVAGALQGLQMGVPSIALSQTRMVYGRSQMDWSTAREHGPKVLRRLVDIGWPDRVALNVNFPECAPDAVKGIQATVQGRRDYDMSDVDKRAHPRGGDYYWLTYSAPKSRPVKGTDLNAVYNNYISVTPIHVDHTHFETAANLGAALGG